MKQKDKELVLKEISLRYPYGIKVFSKILNKPTFVKGIADDFIWVYIDEDNYEWEPVEDVKLYLRPISSMTEKEKEDFDKIRYNAEAKLFNAFSKGGFTLAFHEIVDWLNSRHFDYRGLIGLKLALEPPKGMYKY